MDIHQADEANTKLTEEEKQDLIPTWIVTKDDLNAAEQENILEAEQWAFSKKHKDILTEKFIKDLHKRMFKTVWKWAGKFRPTERNIGVPPEKIQTELRKLLDDTKYWIENNTYPVDELLTRFHHRLVWIHPFPNGNGRMARIMTDIVLKDLGHERFTWGSENLVEMSETRKAYVDALRAGDNGNIEPLLKFVRS